MNNIKVYFDGDCPICSREIDYYKSKCIDKSIEWFDINSNNKNLGPNLDYNKANSRFYIRSISGDLLSGIDAFKVIWYKTPRLNIIARLLEYKFLYYISCFLYELFLVIRNLKLKYKSTFKS